VIASGSLTSGGLYELDECESIMNASDVVIENQTPSKRAKDDADQSMVIWHQRLGHVSVDRINRLVKDGLTLPLDCLKIQPLPTCEHCIRGKMPRPLFSGKGVRREDLLDLIHTDVCGPFSTATRGGKQSFVTFTDDYSRYGFIYLMRHKYELPHHRKVQGILGTG
jgi:hypothetical protein